MIDEPGSLCSDERMHAILAAAAGDGQGGVEAIDAAIAQWPDDGRLHFLRGSLLIGLGRFIEAHASLGRAVSVAPDFHLARFQLGFFELTSGEPEAALASWAPLGRVLPADHYLARFVTGLQALIADRFADAIGALEDGIATNAENPPLNGDMALIISKCREILGQQPTGDIDVADVSATSFLLDTGRR